MQNIVFIPLRSGSKSIKNKNIKIINGKPLFYWVVAASEAALKVDKIFISTDSKHYSRLIKSFDFKKVEIYNRSKESASDNASTEKALIEFLLDKQIQDNCVIVLLQATSPLTKSTDIDNALTLHEKTKKDVLSTVLFKRFLWSDNGTPINYKLNSRPRRQDFKGLNVENGAIYISNCNKIKQSKQRDRKSVV